MSYQKRISINNLKLNNLQLNKNCLFYSIKKKVINFFQSLKDFKDSMSY